MYILHVGGFNNYIALNQINYFRKPSLKRISLYIMAKFRKVTKLTVFARDHDVGM